MSDLKHILGKVAPWIAAAAAGPAGLAGMAIKTAVEALGGAGDTVDDVTAALAAAKPEQIAALRLADLDFQLRMKELGFKNVADMAKIAADDRDSARKANVAGGIQGRVFALVLLIFVSVLSIEAAVLFVGVPEGIDGQMVGRILGTLDAALLAALYYVFGSSAGSAAKTDLLSKQ